MRADPDGGARGEVARAVNVSALALDHASDTLYWVVARQLYAADLDAPTT